LLARLLDRLDSLGIARRRQYAALPWRLGKDGVEILLITSRETRRWVIPKGWPMHGLIEHEAAAQEAFEEAGVRGDIEPTAFGVFRYRKRLKDGSLVTCRVDVFPLAVTREEKSWPEKRQRTRQWTPADEAARLVEEPGLRRLIERFGKRGTP